MKPYLPLLVILLFLLVSPVLAGPESNPPDIGNMTDSQNYIKAYYDDPLGLIGATAIFYNITFKNIQYLSEFRALHYAATINGGIWVTPWTAGVTANDSASSIDGATLTVGSQVISTGRIAYTIDNNNHIYVTYQALTWTPTGLSGDVTATLNYPAGSWKFWRFGNRADATGANLTVSDSIFMHDGAAEVYGDYGLHRWYDYRTFSSVGYERTTDSYTDTWYISRCFDGRCYWSDIEIDFYNNGLWNTQGHSVSNTSLFISVPSGYNTRLIMKNPLTGRQQDLYWVFNDNGSLLLSVSKGTSSGFPAVVGEDITAQAFYSGNPSLIGTILWTWTRDGPSSVVPLKHALYVFNATNSTWENDYSGSSTTRGVYTFAQATTNTIDFMLDDYDGNWTSLGDNKNQVWIQLLDLYNTPVDWASKRVYVGTSGQSMFQFDIVTEQNAHINNAKLWVKDLTTGYMYTGEILASGVIHNKSVINRSYVAWAYHPNYTFSYGCIVSPIQNTCLNYATDSQTVNFTALYLGEENIILKMSPKEAGLLNASYTIRVIDGTYGSAIQGASVRIDYDYNRYTFFTDASGEVKLTRLIVGKSYPYLVKSGTYQPAIGNFSAVNGGYLTIKLYEGAANLTPTPTKTIGPGEIGYVPKSPLDSIIALLMLAGIETTDMAKLMFALLLCAVLAAVFGYYISFQASLIGMVIGFVGSTAMGLIQPWILLVIIFLGSIFLISKWWFAGSIGG